MVDVCREERKTGEIIVSFFFSRVEIVRDDNDWIEIASDETTIESRL